MLKRCYKCGVDKSLDEFVANRNREDGLQAWCKECMRLYRQKYNLENRDELRLNNKQWRDANPDKVRASNLRVKYGIKPEDVSDRCQVCSSTKKICVDHDHITGKIRGYLCHACNRALGCVKDNPDTLIELARYLKKHED